MLVHARLHHVCHAEVIRLIDGALVVSLDTCEEAVLPRDNVFGKTSAEKLTRMLNFINGQRIKVRIVNVYHNRYFKAKLTVEETR